MNINPSFKNSTHLALLQAEFDRVLLFVADICEISNMLLIVEDHQEQLFYSKIGLQFLTNFNEVSCFQSLVIQNKTLTPLSINSNSKHPLAICAQFYINVVGSRIVASLYLMDEKHKEFSGIQLKILNQTILQLESYLNLYKEKEDLLVKKNQTQLFEDNSREIFYELDIEGNYTYVSNNLKLLLGYEVQDVLGKNFIPYIHQDDVALCLTFFNRIKNGEENVVEPIYRVLHNDGHYVWHSSGGRTRENNAGIFYVGVARDITQHVLHQNKLVKQKELYEKILDQLPISVAVYDSTFSYKYLNPAVIKDEKLRKFIIGKNDVQYARYTNRDDAFVSYRKAKYEQAILLKQTVRWEECIDTNKGELSYYNHVITPFFHEDGILEMLVNVGIDITDSKKSQDDVLQTKQFTSSIIKNVAVGILVQGPNSEIIENNLAACEMLGLTQDQLLGKTSFDSDWNVIHLDGTVYESEDHPVPRAIRKLQPVNNTIMGIFRPLTNDRVWLLVDAIPVFDQKNALLYVVCSFNNISQLKKSEEALKVSNERFFYSSEATSDAIWDWNMSTDEVFVGGSYSALFGHKFKNNIITQKEYENFVHPDDRESYCEKIVIAINGTAVKWCDECRYLKSDGTYAFVNNKAIIIRDENALAIRMIGAMQDITLGNKLKEELQLSEQQFKGAFNHSAVGMAIVDKNFYWKETNDKLSEILGYTKNEFKKMTVFEIAHPDDLDVNLAHKAELVLGNITNFNIEKRYIHKNKSHIWIHLFVSVIKNNKGDISHYIPQIIDISKRKKVEEENKLLIEENNNNKNIQLNEAKNMYRLLAENMIDLVCLHNLDASFRYISPSIVSLLGYNPQDLIGKSPFEFVHPEDFKITQKHFLKFIDGKEEISLQLRLRNSAGVYIWFETKAKLVKENGILQSFQSSARDISKRIEAEAAIEKTLNQEKELNELRSNLVSTVSHEFRTPMTTIRTSAELIEIYLEGQENSNHDKLQKHIRTIKSEIDRIVELMNTVLTVSKDDAGKTNFKKIEFDLRATCLDVIETSFSNEKSGRRVVTVFEGATFTIFGDKNLMEYTLFNLLNNAFKYSVGCDDVMLKLTSNGVEAVIQIIDFGIGISKEDQPKLFNSFFRASNSNGIQGTGLGLYIVKKFTEKNSGTVQLESQLGLGTKLILKFPIFAPEKFLLFNNGKAE